MMEYDELELEKLGEEKIALFAVVSDSDPTFNFISAMMYSQMFNVLCNRALTVYHGRLPIHVTCLFDEFANFRTLRYLSLIQKSFLKRPRLSGAGRFSAVRRFFAGRGKFCTCTTKREFRMLFI